MQLENVKLTLKVSEETNTLAYLLGVSATKKKMFYDAVTKLSQLPILAEIE
jgi:hypothetical protein